MITVDSVAFKQSGKRLLFNTVEEPEGFSQYDYTECTIVPRGEVLLVQLKDDRVVIHSEDKLYCTTVDCINPRVLELLSDQCLTGTALLRSLVND